MVIYHCTTQIRIDLSLCFTKPNLMQLQGTHATNTTQATNSTHTNHAKATHASCRIVSLSLSLKVSLFLKVFVKFTDFFYCLLLWAICNFSYLVNCHVMTIFVVFIFGLNLFCLVSQSKPFKHKFYTSQSFLEICQGKVCPNSAGELLSM